MASSGEKAGAELGTEVMLVTAYEVLAEYLGFMAKYGSHMRSQAARMVDYIRGDRSFRIVDHASSDGFSRGFDLYGKRPDKGYSLVDCISMVVMEEEGIRDVLTNDRHFEQEGFRLLLQ